MDFFKIDKNYFEHDSDGEKHFLDFHGINKYQVRESRIEVRDKIRLNIIIFANLLWYFVK